MKQIKNFPNYFVSKCGKVWSSKSKKWLTPVLHHTGYFIVSLYPERRIREIHRLVLETFIGPCPKGMEACHNNGDSQNNKLSNLRWDTRSNNTKDAIKHGIHCSLIQKGENHSQAKLIEQDVRMIIYMWWTKEFTQTEIAKIYNVSCALVCLIVNKKIWKYLWRKNEQQIFTS